MSKTKPKTEGMSLQVDIPAELSLTVKIIGCKTRVDTTFSRFASYVVQVKFGNEEWKIYRRYRQFLQLAEKLRQQFPDKNFPKLPQKHFFRSSAHKDVIAERTQLLDKYLQELLDLHYVYYCDTFRNWLKNEEEEEHLLFGNAEKDGYLMKQSQFGRHWHKRWFVLKGMILYYFKSQKGTRPVKAVSMNDCSIELATDIRAHCIKLTPRKQQPFYISAASAAELDAWIRALRGSSNLYEDKRFPSADEEFDYPNLPHSQSYTTLPPVCPSPSPNLLHASVGVSSENFGSLYSPVVDSTVRRRAHSMSWDSLVTVTSSEVITRDTLTQTKVAVDYDLEEFISGITFDIMRRRFVNTDNLVVDEDHKRDSDDVDSSRAELEVSVLEELRDMAIKIKDTSVDELIRGHTWKKFYKEIMKLQRVNAEYKTVAGSLLFVCLPLSRTIALHRDQKEQHLRQSNNNSAPSFGQKEEKPRAEFLQAVVMMCLTTLGSGIGMGLNKTLANGKVIDLNPHAVTATSVIFSPRHQLKRPMQYSRKKEGVSPRLRKEFVKEIAEKREQKILEKRVEEKEKREREKLREEKAKAAEQVIQQQQMNAEEGQLRKTKSFDNSPTSPKAIKPVYLVCRLCEFSFTVGALPGHTEYCFIANNCCNKQYNSHQASANLITALSNRLSEILNQQPEAYSHYCSSESSFNSLRDLEIDLLTKLQGFIKRQAELSDAEFTNHYPKLSEDIKSLISDSQQCAAPAPLAFARRVHQLIVSRYKLLNSMSPRTPRKGIGNMWGLGSYMKSSTGDPVSGEEEEHIGIEDFEIIKLISRGAFGRVWLARKRKTEDLFAIKVLQKNSIIKKNMVDAVVVERNIMTAARSPYVVNLYYAFQSSDCLYLVMEYLIGGDCASLLEHIGYFENEMAQVYIAHAVLALEYLHAQGIIHRDLKPDNMLIDAHGHIKLTDFGLSKHGLMKAGQMMGGTSRGSFAGELDAAAHLLPPPVDLTSSAPAIKHPSPLQSPEMPSSPQSHRVVGTPDYLSPEALLGTGHGTSVDWWALGVTLFEFLTGIPPFNDETPELIFQNILNRDIPWPKIDEEISYEAFNLISGLLTPEISERLGSRGAKEVKTHSYFRGINWDTLMTQSMEQIFIPRPVDATDTGYFDPRDDVVSGSGNDLQSPTGSSDSIYSNVEFGGFSFKNIPLLSDLTLAEASKHTSHHHPMLDQKK